ncbi:ABC transporter permease, partial [uncultured Pseudoflavonifractor sp.]|uniref:ABC transporter permease n=1 Tax=uncultured Pseudoflavonifractor sp. TaxID=1221379 RepID=UPI0025FAC7E4
MDKVLSFVVAAVLAGTPLLFGTLGEILTEKSGNLNLGVEGMMFMGGVAGLAGSYYYEQAVASPNPVVSVVIAIVCAILCAAFGALIYSVLTITLRANQNVTGLALTIFGTGFANFLGEAIGNTASSRYMAVGNVTKNAFNSGIPVLQDLPVVGKLLFSYNFMVYLGIVVAIILAWFLGRSRAGLNLRSVGESPATADAAGINVTVYKYLATCVGGGICGLGGLYIVMNSANGVGGVWVHNCVNGKGWIAVALVIFATWSPARALLGSLVFGALSVMRLYVALGIPAQIYDIFPYIATVIVLVAVSMRRKR